MKLHFSATSTSRGNLLDFNRVGISVSSPFNTGGPAMLAPPGTPTPIVRNQENIGETYRYDVLGRLRTVTTNKDNSGTFAAEATGGWSSQYKYDPHGNVLSVFKRGLDATAISIVLDDATMTLKQTGVAPSTSNVVASVIDSEGDHANGGQEIQTVIAGLAGSEIDEKGRVAKYSSPSNAVETMFNANDLALTAKRKDHTTTFLRDAFDQIVRQVVNSGTTDNTYVTIPLSPLVSQAIYHYDGIETVQLLEWTIQDGNRIGVDRTTANTLVGGVNYRQVGDVLYELKGQVGSVRALVSDVVDEDPNNAGKYQAQVLGVSDYEPFGSRRVHRYSELTAPYRYGWQGMMLMDGHEVRFDYVTPFRLYDTRVGRWTSTDATFKTGVSPYESMGGNPINMIDPAGDDFLYSRRGNVVTIDVRIKIYGNRASKKRAKQIKSEQYATWGAPVWHGVDKDGVKVTMKIRITVDVFDPKNPSREPSVGELNRWDGTNYVKVTDDLASDNSEASAYAEMKLIPIGHRSITADGHIGVWAGNYAQGQGAYCHELGHLLGNPEGYWLDILKPGDWFRDAISKQFGVKVGDKYPIPKEGWERNVMYLGTLPAGQINIDEILKLLPTGNHTQMPINIRSSSETSIIKTKDSLGKSMSTGKQ